MRRYIVGVNLNQENLAKCMKIVEGSAKVSVSYGDESMMPFSSVH